MVFTPVFIRSNFESLPVTCPCYEAVSQFVIPAKPRETGREPGSRSQRDDAVSLDSGSRYAARRSSGMTGLRYYDTASISKDNKAISTQRFDPLCGTCNVRHPYTKFFIHNNDLTLGNHFVVDIDMEGFPNEFR